LGGSLTRRKLTALTSPEVGNGGSLLYYRPYKQEAIKMNYFKNGIDSPTYLEPVTIYSENIRNKAKLCFWDLLFQDISKKILLIIFLITLFPMWGVSFPRDTTSLLTGTQDLTTSQKKAIEVYIVKQMKMGQIPGMAVVIVKGKKTVYLRGFGFSDLKTGQPVTPHTLFELGSTSKAFTGLAILQLHDKKMLSLSDPVRKYIPWLKMIYQEKEVNLKIEQFLYQTSGVPFRSIADIPVASDKDALENTVKTLVGDQLDYFPGKQFSYATINYDVLGLIIEAVTGFSFEEYVKTSLLKPLGLYNTYLFRNEARHHGMAKGYKICFGNLYEYNAPVYRGNTPAGYFITNAYDLARWLKIQMNQEEIPDFNQALITVSHQPDRKIDSSYAAGWFVTHDNKDQGENGIRIYHGGENPNFSSFITFIPEEKLGVAVLINIRSSYSEDIPLGILDILAGREPRNPWGDENMEVDNQAVVIIIVSLVLIFLTLVLLIVFIRQFFRKKRKFRGFHRRGLVFFLISTFLLVIFYCILSYVPDIVFWGLTWNFVLIWGPGSLLYAVIGIILAIFFIYLYLLLRYFFPKTKQELNI
jgi:putative pyoverdin transport system ATP-binding/permease protein